MEDKFCDQRDCPDYPYDDKIIEKKEENIIVNNSSYYGNFVTYTVEPIYSQQNIKKLSSETKIEEAEVTMKNSCLFCSYCKKLDLKTLKKIFKTKEVLNE